MKRSRRARKPASGDNYQLLVFDDGPTSASPSADGSPPPAQAPRFTLDSRRRAGRAVRGTIRRVRVLVIHGGSPELARSVRTCLRRAAVDCVIHDVTRGVKLPEPLRELAAQAHGVVVVLPGLADRARRESCRFALGYLLAHFEPARVCTLCVDPADCADPRMDVLHVALDAERAWQATLGRSLGALLV